SGTTNKVVNGGRLAAKCQIPGAYDKHQSGKDIRKIRKVAEEVSRIKNIQRRKMGNLNTERRQRQQAKKQAKADNKLAVGHCGIILMLIILRIINAPLTDIRL